MIVPRLTACLLALFAATNVAALQLGQLSTESRLGENLKARIELYGINATEASALTLELKPRITALEGGAERAAVTALSIRVAAGPDAAPYIELSSRAPINEPLVSFRLRAATGQITTIARYTLALLPASYQTPAAAAPNSEPSSAVAHPAQSYGPVSSGQTLWKILRELGLTRGETTSLIERIVVANPHAFSNGDANRLRVGVMLDIPAGASASAQAQTEPTPSTAVAQLPLQVRETLAPTAPTLAAPDAPASNPASANFDDAETEARLAALASKFAAIKARYAERQSVQPELPSRPEQSLTKVLPAPPRSVPPAVESGAQAQGDRAVTGMGTPAIAPAKKGTSLTLRIIMGVSALIALAVLIQGGIMAVGRWRRRRAHGHAAAGEQELVAGIALKAEKRLQLEGEVKRRMTKDREPKPDVASTVERSVERESAIASLDEIENRIAHGQYAEAEAMLNDVIAATPNNARAKLRLAEIYYLNERTDEFVELATEISSRHRADIGDDGWRRIMRMGKVIAPDRPPFSGPVSVTHNA